jgi:hypothetical protein
MSGSTRGEWVVLVQHRSLAYSTVFARVHVLRIRHFKNQWKFQICLARIEQFHVLESKSFSLLPRFSRRLISLWLKL